MSTAKKRKRKQAAIPHLRDRTKIKELNASLKKARQTIKVAEKERDLIVKKYMAQLKKDWKMPPKASLASHEQHRAGGFFVQRCLKEAEKALRAGQTRVRVTWKKERKDDGFYGYAAIQDAQAKKGKKVMVDSRSYNVQTGSYHVDRWGSQDTWTTYYEIKVEIEL